MSESQASSSQTATAPTDNSRRWTETYQEKVVRKVTENPYVPIGALLTTGALVMASVRLRQGNSKKFQHWLRARVALQTVTVFAVLGGLYKYGQANLEENQRIMEAKGQKAMELKAKKEREEFEERIRQAKVAQMEEEAVRQSQQTTSDASTSLSTSSSSWLSWFGRSSTPTTIAAKPTPAPAPSASSEPQSPAASSASSEPPKH